MKIWVFFYVNKHTFLICIIPVSKGTCYGDSGAPLWIEDEGRLVVVGVLHGLSHFGPPGSEVCGTGREETATKLNEEIIKWIRFIL